MLSDEGVSPSPTNHADPCSFSFSLTNSRTSHHSAPSRRMRRMSSARRAARALSAFAIGVVLAHVCGHQLVDPGRVPVVQAGVVDQGELLPAGAVAAKVSGA